MEMAIKSTHPQTLPLEQQKHDRGEKERETAKINSFNITL
jgi:hypothetical protein